MNGFVFDKGIDITPVQSPMGFTYGAGVFGPEVEIRRLEDIRASLRDPQCKGPEQVYSIAMDVGKEEHRALLNKLHLLFGVVTYSAGKLGQEPVRSQGHIHKISPYSGWSTPEIYEIWSGEAILPHSVNALPSNTELHLHNTEFQLRLDIPSFRTICRTIFLSYSCPIIRM